MAAALTATNFVWVMWNRAALLETTMVVPMTAALYAYARADALPACVRRMGRRRPALAVLAFFAKAAAAFFPGRSRWAAVVRLAHGGRVG